MFRLIASAYVVFLFFVFLFVFARVDQSASQETLIASSRITAEPTAAITEITTPTDTPTPTPIPMGNPVRIVIPRLHIDTVIEPKGNDSQGHMDVPADWFHTAWYTLGPKPGEDGSAVIAGHYDTNTGAPAAFYYLSALQPGDPIYIVDETNKVLTFKVVEKRNYNYDLFPVDEVFNDPAGKKLNLITCSGVWNHALHNYSDRLVVYTELQ